MILIDRNKESGFLAFWCAKIAKADDVLEEIFAKALVLN
jgi:hypothetical protein